MIRMKHKKLCSLVLVLAMLFGLMPAGFVDAKVFADELPEGSINLRISTVDQGGEHIEAIYTPTENKIYVLGKGIVDNRRWLEFLRRVGDKNPSEIDFRCLDGKIILDNRMLNRFTGDITFDENVSIEGRTSLNGMFYEAQKFNQDISGWDTSNITIMSGTFYLAKKFNQDISNWDTSKVRDMTDMFFGAENMKKIVLLNRGDAKNTLSLNIFSDTKADEYRFKGLKSFKFKLPNTYYVCVVENGKKKLLGQFARGTIYIFEDNKEYHVTRQKPLDTVEDNNQDNDQEDDNQENNPLKSNNGFAISNDGKIVAKLKNNELQIIGDGESSIDKSKWKKMAKFVDANNYKKDASAWAGSEDFDIVFKKAGNKKTMIYAPSSASYLFANFDGDIKFNNLFSAEKSTTMREMFRETPNFKGEFVGLLSKQARDMTRMFMKSGVKKIDLSLNRDDAKNKPSENIFIDTNADSYKFKGLRAFTWTTKDSYYIKNMKDNVVSKVESGDTVSFEKNVEYIVTKDEQTANTLIKPSGEPKYNKIITEGKKLKDAQLKKGTISVAGKIKWDLDDKTKVEANKEYAWTFTPDDSAYSKLTGKIVLYQKELDKPKENHPMVSESKARLITTRVKFNDLDYSKWYVDGINYVVNAGIMNGVGDDRFNPSGKITKAMLVTMLYRLSGDEKVNGVILNDVPNGTWYTDSCNWAFLKKVARADDVGFFEPKHALSREEFVYIIFRYANYKQLDTTPRANLSKYKDLNQVDETYRPAFEWAVKKGIIQGMSATTLSPESGATRAQMATIFMRFIELYR